MIRLERTGARMTSADAVIRVRMRKVAAIAAFRARTRPRVDGLGFVGFLRRHCEHSRTFDPKLTKLTHPPSPACARALRCQLCQLPRLEDTREAARGHA